MSPGRVTSALRDDIREQCLEQQALYRKKLQYLKKFLASESDKIVFMKSGKTDKCIALLEEDQETIAEIDALDYSIKKTDDELARKLGIRPGDINEYLRKRKEEPIREIYEVKTEIESLVAELLGKRKEIIRLMEKSADEVKKYILELESLDRIKKSGLLNSGL